MQSNSHNRNMRFFICIIFPHSVNTFVERMVYYMNLDKIVCNCMSVTNGMIKDAVEAGANTLEEVQEATGASTVCGACLEDVQHLIDFFVAERSK